MENKIIITLLIVAVFILMFSLFITLNLNTSKMQFKENTSNVNEPDLDVGKIGFAIESTLKNQNEK